MKRYILPYQNGKYTIWHISVLIFISWKRIKAAKRIVKSNVDNGECDNIGNIAVIQGWLIFDFFILLLVKYFVDQQEILEVGKNFGLAKKSKL